MLRFQDDDYSNRIPVFENYNDPRSLYAFVASLEYLLDKKEVQQVLIVFYCLQGNHRSVHWAELIAFMDSRALRKASCATTRAYPPTDSWISTKSARRTVGCGSASLEKSNACRSLGWCTRCFLEQQR